MKKTIIVEIIASAFILLFLYTGLTKLVDHIRFKSVITSALMTIDKDLPLNFLSLIISWALPILEILIAIFLFIPRTKKWGLYASTGLMIFFTGYLAFMIKYAQELPCSCGGVISLMTWQQHLVFNVAFSLLGLLGIRRMRRIKRNQDALGTAAVA